MLISTFVFLFFLFLVYGLFLLASRKSDAREERLQQRVAEALRGLGPADAPIQISREDSIGGHPLINRLLSSLDFVKRMDRMISQADVDITVSRLLTFCFIAAVFAGLAAYTVLNFIVAFPLGLLAGI